MISKQSENGSPPKGKYVSQQTKKELPPICSILQQEEETSTPEDQSSEPITPAELLTDKELTPEQKKLELQRMWGRAGGRKSAKKTTKWKPIFITVARQLASLGVPEQDIAALFQVTRGTFNQWKRAHQPLRAALKEGDGLKRSNLLMQMQTSAANGIFQMQMFLAKNWLGMTDRQDVNLKGTQTIIYKSQIPQEKGTPDVDPGSVKRSGKKLQDRE